MAYKQIIDDVDIRRYKRCFDNSIGTSKPIPCCQYITNMTGLTLGSIRKLSKQLHLIPCDLNKKRSERIDVADQFIVW
jgi:hypothetical protein